MTKLHDRYLHLHNDCMFSHCWTRSLWVWRIWSAQNEFNKLWPSGAIWCQRSWSTLVQVMAWCLMAPSHYLNQFWLPIVFASSWPGFMMTSSNGNIFRVTGHLCGNSPVPGEFPAQRPVTRSFDVFFDLYLNTPLSKQIWGWWIEMLSHPLWCHCNVTIYDTTLYPTFHFSMLTYHQLNLFKHISMKKKCQFRIFNSREILWKVLSAKWLPFCSGLFVLNENFPSILTVPVPCHAISWCWSS